MEKRLGKGLGALLTKAGPVEAGRDVELARIRPNPYQPRKEFDQGALEELRDSIKSHGILQPVVVRTSGDGFELVSGERRWRAAKLAGLDRIPASIREEVTDDQMLELALVENVQRRDLGPIEKAQGYRDLMTRLRLTQEGVAAKVGMRRSSVANHLRLLELPEPVQEALEQRLLTMGHARALLGLPDDEERVSMMESIVRDELSVREVEKGVRERVASPSGTSKEASPEATVPAWVEDVQARMRESLGTKVTVKNGPKYKGQIIIDYYDRNELERLLEFLAPRKSL